MIKIMPEYIILYKFVYDSYKKSHNEHASSVPAEKRS